MSTKGNARMSYHGYAGTPEHELIEICRQIADLAPALRFAADKLEERAAGPVLNETQIGELSKLISEELQALVDGIGEAAGSSTDDAVGDMYEEAVQSVRGDAEFIIGSTVEQEINNTLSEYTVDQIVGAALERLGSK